MKRFLLGVLVGIVLAVMGSLIFVFATLRFAKTPPVVPDGAVLSLRLSGSMPEMVPVELPFGAFAQQSPITTVDAWRILRRAANDSRIKGVFLRPRSFGVGWGKLDELRDGILLLRKAGKPVYALLESPSTREYYLATAADKIFLSPEDILDLKGLRIQASYYKNTLDKVGVQVEVEHVGKYKDAADTFARDSMTPETRQVLNGLLDDTLDRLVRAIATSRGKKPEEVRAALDDGPFLASAAKSAGLIDDLLYEDQVEGRMRDLLRVKELKKISHQDYLRDVEAEAEGGAKRRPRIAMVVAQGDIVRGAAADLLGEDQFIAPGPMARQLRAIGEDTTIRAVILRVDSPGGDAIASDEILRVVKELSKKKPLVVSMADVAASGGYYIAMSGDPIVAYPGTLTGSIGVVYGKVNMKGLYEKLGIKTETLKRGRFADIDSSVEPLTPEGRAKLRESLESIYDGFVKRVAEGRHQEYAVVDQLAQGRVWLGSQAKANRLVDELGGLDKAIELAKSRAGIGAEQGIRLIVYPARRSLLDMIFGRDAGAVLPLESEVSKRFGAGIVPWIQGGYLQVMPYLVDIR
jgi:protease IV